MYSTAKELRFHTKELLESPYAKLVPIKETKKEFDKANELFGIWENRADLEDVNSYVRNIRRGRFA
jgi:hypothetical protein